MGIRWFAKGRKKTRRVAAGSSQGQPLLFGFLGLLIEIRLRLLKQFLQENIILAGRCETPREYTASRCLSSPALYVKIPKDYC